MKSPRVLLLITFIAGALAGAWLVGRFLPHGSMPEGGTPEARIEAKGSKKVLFYQSPMHPWIRSDQPGRCTICGMELTPVHEGETGAAIDGPAIVLGTNAIQLIHLETHEVARGPLERTLRLSGTIDDNDVRHRVISAPVAGRIERLAINQVSQEVRAGEALLTLYSPFLLTAEREYAALVRQTGVPGAIGADAMAPILASARQKLLQMGLTPAQVDALRDKPSDAITSDLLSRVDGTVVLKQVYEGQYVAEGERLFEIADFSTMWVQLTAYEADRPWLSVGQEVRLTTPSWHGGVVTGRVSFIDPNYDPMTRSSRVRVEVPNPIEDTPGGRRRRLLHRLTARAEIVHATSSLTVPRSALLWDGRQAVAYRSLGGGAFERRPVRVGRIGDRAAEILEGLDEGDRVVSQAAFLIDSQAQIRGGSGGGSSAPGEPAPVADSGPAPAPLTEFLGLSADLSEALAADRLDGFRAALAQFAPRLDALRPWAADPSTPMPEALRNAVASIDAPTEAVEPRSLAEARQWFLGQTRTVLELARWAHRQGWAPEVRAFECPMVDRAIPSAPKRASWLQRGSAVRNPFFGAEMLDCGVELKEKP
ncbi:MAG: efflux RND transporter periplasmic adaptor subunit [Verrucomicrobiota bacterium]